MNVIILIINTQKPLQTVRTLSTEALAELVLLSLCPLPSISSSSTIPDILMVPSPLTVLVAQASISITVPVELPNTASPFIHPTARLLSLFCQYADCNGQIL